MKTNAILLAACVLALAYSRPDAQQNGRLSPIAKQGIAGTKVVVLGGSLGGGATIGTLQCLNTTAAVAYLQLFNKLTANVTVGTTTPDLAFGIPASGQLSIPDANFWFGIGIVAAGTTTSTGLTGAALDCNFGVR